MESRALRIGWIIMLILGLFRLVMSFVLMATGWDINSSILLGLTGAAIIGMTLGAYRKAEKWSWWTLLIVGVVPPLACSITHGARPDVIIGWILVVPALLIPVKAFFAKKSA